MACGEAITKLKGVNYLFVSKTVIIPLAPELTKKQTYLVTH